jgi:hypothetical protein
MKNTHTPGPWAILERAEDSRTHISNGAHIVCTLGTTRTDGSPNHSPNALLIAAAPDLLSALEKMMAVFQDHEQYDEESAEVIQSARATLRKAKGEA